MNFFYFIYKKRRSSTYCSYAMEDLGHGLVKKDGDWFHKKKKDGKHTIPPLST